MNERIRELAIEAGAKVIGDQFRYMKMYEDDIEKFAELIVRECMAIAKNWEDELENANMLSESNAAGIVSYRIARQFGVKE